MKALLQKEIGSWPQYTEVDDIKVDRSKIKVSLKASSLNHRDVWITEGKYPGINFPSILGSDGCGTINWREVIINPGLNWGNGEAFQSDDFEVLGMPTDGTFAEEIAIESRYIYDKPSHLSMEQAAALPLSGVTAYRALFTRCQLFKGEKVLISGIGGGVAQFAFQFALAHGAEVYVTSGSDEKLEKAISLGASGGVNYKDPEWYKKMIKMSGGIDVVIDSAGGDGFQHFIKLTNPGGRIGFYGASLGKYNNINPQLLFWRQISVLGSTMGSDKDFADMLNFVNLHKIEPIIDEVFPLADAAAGFEKMKSGKQFGKIVFSH